MRPPIAQISRTGLLTATALVAAAFAGSAAYASAFNIKEQSVTGLGRAFAGQAAVSEDATTIYYNPAGLTQLERAEADVGVHVLFPQSDRVRDRGSTFGPLLNIPTGGGDGGEPYDVEVIPNLYGAMPFADGRFWVGIGVTAPFGLALEYDDAWFGRYDSIKSELATVNVAPTIAYRINDWASVGAGLDIQYADAELTNAVPTPASLVVGAPGDLISRLQGDDVSLGFNVGALFEPSPPLRIGLHYRSAISHTLTGDINVRTRDGVLVQSFRGEADLDLPDIAAVSVAWQATPQLRLLAEVDWYGWSNFEEIRAVRGSTGEVVSDVDQNYDDTFAVSAGLEYAPADRWTVRTGYQYDETPSTAEFRTTRVPDGDRNWIAFGASYEINERFVFDAGYAHVFVRDVDTNAFRPPFSPGAGVGSNTITRSGGSVNIVSIGLRTRFGAFAEK